MDRVIARMESVIARAEYFTAVVHLLEEEVVVYRNQLDVVQTLYQDLFSEAMRFSDGGEWNAEEVVGPSRSIQRAIETLGALKASLQFEILTKVITIRLVVDAFHNNSQQITPLTG